MKNLMNTADLKLASFPTRSPLPVAALPSISLIPSARSTDVADNGPTSNAPEHKATFEEP
jgi:hypothetical protein